MMAIDAALDLRKFIDQVRSDGELEEIAGAHWHLEIGALTELFAEQASTPTLSDEGDSKVARSLSRVNACGSS